jgi:hypothetical protein
VRDGQPVFALGRGEAMLDKLAEVALDDVAASYRHPPEERMVITDANMATEYKNPEERPIGIGAFGKSAGAGDTRSWFAALARIYGSQ